MIALYIYYLFIIIILSLCVDDDAPLGALFFFIFIISRKFIDKTIKFICVAIK